MASYTISPIWGAGAQLLDNSGNVLSGGKIYTYAAGTTSPVITYTDPLGTTANTNPIIANAAGRLTNEIWFPVSGSYKFVLKDSNDVLLATYDNIPTTPQPPIVNDSSSISYDTGYIVNAGNFTIGETYRITTVGTTDFVAIGAGGNVNGILFTATGVGSGTGTAEYVRTVKSKLRDTASVKDFGAVGDGIVDDTTAFQAAVDLSGADVLCIDLANATYVITTVNVPSDKTVLIQNGSVIVSGASSAGFSKVTTVAPTGGIKNPTVFSNVKFTRTQSGGSCAFVKLAWQDLTAGLIVEPSCTFNLSNGAVGLRLARSGSNKIAGSYFMDATSTAILCDATEVVPGDAYPAGPLNSSIDNATFNGGIGFDQIYNPASGFNSFEGFTFGPSTIFYASRFFAKKYNLVTLNGCKLVSAQAIFDSGFNTKINGVYADKQASDGNVPLLTFTTTIRNHQQILIENNIFDSLGSASNMILFSDQGAAPGTQITNVIISGNSFTGVNNIATKVVGILFDNAATRNVNIDSSLSFFNVYACVSFDKSINRSIINCFSARDITWYVENVATGYSGGYNKFDGFYKVLSVRMFVPTFVGNGVDEPISSQTIGFSMMPSPPIATVTTASSYPIGYFTLSAPATDTSTVEIWMKKTTIALTGQRGEVIGQLILDCSQYQAPW